MICIKARELRRENNERPVPFWLFLIFPSNETKNQGTGREKTYAHTGCNKLRRDKIDLLGLEVPLRSSTAIVDGSLARQRTLRVEQVCVDDLETVHGHFVEVRYRLHVVGDRVPVSLP